MTRKQITDMIRAEFGAVRAASFPDLTFRVDDERAFMDSGRTDDGTAVYIVAKYGDATVNYGASAIPITLEVMGLAGSVSETQDFLDAFAQAYNMRDGQFWQSARAVSNFAATAEDLRATFAMTGYFVYLEDGIDITELTYVDGDGNEEEVQLLNFTDSTDAQAEPIVFAGSDGRTKSFVSSTTYSFTITVYARKSRLLDDVMAVKFKAVDPSAKRFAFNAKIGGYDYEDGYTFKGREFVLSHAGLTKNQGEVNTMSLTFTL